MDLSEYIGLPFKERGRDRSGLDCWGLLRLILQEQFNADLPCHSEDYESTWRSKQVAPLIKVKKDQYGQQIVKGREQPGDVALFNILGRPMHVGLVVGEKKMLHIEREQTSCLERYDTGLWRPRLAGFYRCKTGVRVQA